MPRGYGISSRALHTLKGTAHPQGTVHALCKVNLTAMKKLGINRIFCTSVMDCFLDILVFARDQ